MDTLQPEVHAALTATGYSFAYFYPEGAWSAQQITWRESENSVKARVDNAEFLTRVSYTLDAWAKTPEETATMGATIDTQMTAIGLERTFSHDLFEAESSLHHKNMRYSGIIHVPQQKIYQ